MCLSKYVLGNSAQAISFTRLHRPGSFFVWPPSQIFKLTAAPLNAAVKRLCLCPFPRRMTRCQIAVSVHLSCPGLLCPEVSCVGVDDRDQSLNVGNRLRQSIDLITRPRLGTVENISRQHLLSSYASKTNYIYS